MKRYMKAIVACLSLGAAWAVVAFADGHVSTAELFGLIPVVLGSLGVYQVPNSPPQG
jgi:prepilin-type processing-associated H-X9-DG protein